MELADLVGFEWHTIQRIENANTNPSLETIDALAVALGVTPHDLTKPSEFSPRGPGRPKTKK